jgi:hypothetical protein
MFDTYITKSDSHAIGQLTNTVKSCTKSIVDAVTPPKKTIIVTIEYDEYEREKQISYYRGRSQGYINCCVMIAEWKKSGIEMSKYIELTGKYDLFEVLNAFDNPSKYINERKECG